MDAVGNPLRLHLTAGQKWELDGADVLLPGLKARTVIADKGFDAEATVRSPTTLLIGKRHHQNRFQHSPLRLCPMTRILQKPTNNSNSGSI